MLFFFFFFLCLFRRLVSEIVVVEPCRTTGEVEMPKSMLANAAKFGRYYVLFTSASGKFYFLQAHATPFTPSPPPAFCLPLLPSKMFLCSRLTHMGALVILYRAHMQEQTRRRWRYRSQTLTDLVDSALF